MTLTSGILEFTIFHSLLFPKTKPNIKDPSGKPEGSYLFF